MCEKDVMNDTRYGQFDSYYRQIHFYTVYP